MATSHQVNLSGMKGLNTPRMHPLIVPVWIHHRSNSSNKLSTYILPDEQSDTCFVKEELLRRLDVSGPEVELKLSTVLGEKVITSKGIKAWWCMVTMKKWGYLFPKAIQDLQSLLRAKKCQIPRPKSMLNKPHLHKTSEIIMPLNKVLEVGVLLFNIKIHVQKLLGEKDFISENNRNLNSTWEF